MAIDYDAASVSASGTGNLSWTHTPVGTPRGAIVFVVQDLGGDDQVSGVTYGGNAMTEIAGSPMLKATGEPAAVHGYFLGTSLPTGAQTVVVTTTDTEVKIAGAYTVTAAADVSVNAVSTALNADGFINPIDTLALGSVESFVSEGFFSGASAVANNTPRTDWTNRGDLDFGVSTAGFYTYDTIATADVDVGFLNSTSNEDVVCLAVALQEAAAGATGTGTPAAQSATVVGVGTAGNVSTVELTAAQGRELRDENNAVVASLTGIVWEWYDTPGATNGNPIDSGTTDTNAGGETTISVTGSALTSGQFGQLILYHPSDTSIRGSYRVPVS